jgi:hypothetical protein
VFEEKAIRLSNTGVASKGMTRRLTTLKDENREQRDAMSKNKEICPAPGCTKIGNFARTFCSKHYLEFRRDCVANHSWSRDVEASPAALPPFEWIGDEQALFEMTERLEREKQTRS